jgi:hypothetical protein
MNKPPILLPEAKYAVFHCAQSPDKWKSRLPY